MSKYGYTKEVTGKFKNIIESTIEALKIEGFGILTKIDIQAKMKEKLGKDFNDYVILGACNPKIAYEVLKNEIEIGLLLPCNVIVYKKEGKIYVSAIMPCVAMSFIDNPTIEPMKMIVEEKLKKVIDSL